MPISGTFSDGDAVSFKDCLVEVDITDAGTWADIDSWATEVTVSGGDVPTTETYPFEGSAVVFTGNKSPFEVEVSIIYTEGSTDAFLNIWNRFADNDGPAFEVRWVPKGSGSGNLRFSTSGGKLIACSLPQGAGDASSANICTFRVRANTISDDTM